MTQANVKLPAASGAARRGDPGALPGRVGDWELVHLAGEGSLSQVYQARPLARPPDGPAAYALKLLRPPWQDDARAIELIRREALVGQEVTHPHLVAVLAATVTRAPYFLVMPWLRGRTLARHLAETSLDVPVALWIARQVAEALSALQGAGWMHADVKPGNLFISPEGHVTLLDLGFARRPDQETGSAVDRCVAGTWSYIAPEMITSALRADVRSDVYSLGVVLFEMLSGRLPFEGKGLGELATQHRQAQAPDLRRLVPQLPSGVVHLVRQMLAKEPLRRPQTPAELIDRLIRLEVETFAERAMD